MRICIFEDNRYSNFLPLVYFRPVYELRCGVLSLREKIASVVPTADISLHVRPSLAEILTEEFPHFPVNLAPVEDSWFVNGRFLPDDGFGKFIRKRRSTSKVFLSGGQLTLAFITASDIRKFWHEAGENLFSGDFMYDYPHEDYGGTLLQYPWEIVHRTAEEINRDAARIRVQKHIAGKIYPGAYALNQKNIVIGKGTVVKSGAVLDAEHGPIVIGENVTIMPNAVIEGPAYVGAHSVIKIGAKIYHGSSIGKYCKVGGEVEASVIQSYANKQHDGFLGHSYLGSWVNLGADTNTSDLKNTYGNVSVYVGGRPVDTGLQFVGLTMGDHSKTGINVMFDTGSVVGISCNIFGAGLPPKDLPSFCWGERNGFSAYQIDKGVSTARMVMARRGVNMTPAYETHMRSLFAATDADRRAARIV